MIHLRSPACEGTPATRARLLAPLALALLALACGGRDSTTSDADLVANARSAEHGLELGQVHERYGATAAAFEAYAQAARAAETQPVAEAAYAGMARMARTRDEAEGAIGALERALAERESRWSDGNPAGPGAHEIERMLAELYVDAERYEEAETLYLQLIAGQRERIYANRLRYQLVELYERAGSLEQRAEAWTDELANGSATEDVLWLLAIVHGAGELSWPGAPPPAAAPGEPPDWSALAETLHQLSALHPGDPHLRQGLMRAYEKSGRVEDAVALAREPAPAREPMFEGPLDDGPRTGSACPQGMAPTEPKPDEVAAAERAVWVLIRADRNDDALAETERLAQLARASGPMASVVAARLYAVLGDRSRAEQALAQGRAVAATDVQRRELASAERFVLENAGDRAAIEALFDRWADSGDPCLSGEAQRRRERQARLAARSAAHHAGVTP